MSALNFKKQFVSKILSGEKRQTIRSRKRPIKEGERLYLYTGQRTKHCQKIAESICSRTQNIIISNYQLDSYSRVFLDCEQLCTAHVKELAIRDGFENVEEFFEFFLSSPKAETKGLVTSFTGQLIKWGMLCK